MNRHENLQQLDFRQKPGMFRTYGGFAVKAITIGVIGGALWATIASSCSMHKTFTPLARQDFQGPGIYKRFHRYPPVTTDEMPHEPAMYEVDHEKKYDI